MIWSLAISTQSSQRCSSIASRNALEPLALVRSPIERYDVSCRNGTCWYRLEAPALATRAARDDLATAHPLDDLAQVLGRGAAAAAHEPEPVLARERVVRVGELLRGERVARAARRASSGRPALGMQRHADLGVPREVAQVLAHLGRPGGAVQADHVDAERLERGERGADLGADAASCRWSRRSPARCTGRSTPAARDRPLRPDDGGLGLQQVLAVSTRTASTPPSIMPRACAW